MDRMDRMSKARTDQSPQRYVRSGPSFAGTSRSIETRVTSGHSDTSSNSIPSKRDDDVQQHEQVPSDAMTEGRDSASIYGRDLPAPPVIVIEPQERPFSSATRDAEELVAAYSNRDGDSSIQRAGEDAYDGLADDEETSDGHQDGDMTRDSILSGSRDLPLPTPPVKGLTVTPPKARDDGDPTPATMRRPLRSVSPDPREERRVSKPLPSP
jgi:hypothetical protein